MRRSPSETWMFSVCLLNSVKKEKVKERIVLREIHLRTTERHLSNGITQCYLLPDRGGRPAFTPTGQVGTRFIDPVRMKGWVGCTLCSWLPCHADWRSLVLQICHAFSSPLPAVHNWHILYRAPLLPKARRRIAGLLLVDPAPSD